MVYNVLCILLYFNNNNLVLLLLLKIFIPELNWIKTIYLTYFLDFENESTINIINIPRNVYNIKSSKIEFVL